MRSIYRVDIDAQQLLRRILIIFFQIALKPRPVEQPCQRIDVIKRDSVRSVGRRLSIHIAQNKRDARMFLIAQPARNSQQPDPMICAVVLLLTVSVPIPDLVHRYPTHPVASDICG